MTKPMSREQLLNELVSIVNGIKWGMTGYDQRLTEMSSGFPSRGSGGGAKGNVSRPVESLLGLNVKPPAPGEPEDPRWGMDDPAARMQAEFNKRLTTALRAAEELWAEYAKVAQPRKGSAMVTKPGCELCALVPCGCDRCNAQDHRHHCDALYTVKRKGPAKKGQQPVIRPWKLCSSCYEFQRPDRADRLPTHDEVLDHVEGRRRRWKVGA